MLIGIFVWHYTKGIAEFLVAWKNLFEYVWYHFSVKRFLRTLFSPWRRDVSRISQGGFHPVLMLQAAFENFITRILGSIVRSILIFWAIFLEILILFLGLVAFIIWVLSPIVLFLSLLSLILSLNQENYIFVIFSGLAFIVSITMTIVSFQASRDRSNDYAQMELSELNKEKWFKRVWNRIGKEDVKLSNELSWNIENIKDYLKEADITPEEFIEILNWEVNNYIHQARRKKFWLRENLLSGLPIGRNWAYAYTVHLDRYSKDLSEGDFSEYKDAQLIGKNKELEELELILSRPSQNSVLVVGEPGVGRNTLIHTLAKRIRMNQVEGYLANKRVLELDLKSILADASSEKDSIIQMIFTEATYAGNVILVINNLHDYLDETYGYNLAAVLSDYLSYPNFQIIGTTTSDYFHSVVSKKGNIMKYCDKIMVEESSPEDTLRTLLYSLKGMEEKHVVFTYQALREIVDVAGRYLNDAPFPEKALDLMEEVILYWNNNGTTRFITKEVVDEAVSAKLKIPLGELKENESESLLHLEEILHQRIIGQDFAISQIAETVRKTRVGMTDKNKPLGSFLFLGPTGVGKTESAKALAETYFGDENRMIRLDMSEYQNVNAIDRILGSMSTGQEGVLVSKVKDSPHALLLLDEIEKAYPDILNLFLQVLDEGHLTDAFGKKVSFRNLIIIATSNAGSDIIKESIETGLDAKTTQTRLIDHIIREGIFRPEFLNRFEGVIYFHPLTPTEIIDVAKLLLQKYSQRLKEKENIDVVFDDSLPEFLAQNAYDPIFGARAVNRYIEDKIGDKIVKSIIAGNIKKGESMQVGIEILE